MEIFRAGQAISGISTLYGTQDRFCLVYTSAKVNAEVVLITTSDLDMSLLIHQEDEDVALNALNKAFEL